MDCKQKIQNKLEATEMWFLRRMMKIPWTAKKTNAEVLIDAGVKRLKSYETLGADSQDF